MPDPLPDEDLQGYPVPATATLEASPGRAIIGTQAVPVGVQPPLTQADLTAWQSRQPNLDVGLATQQAIARAAEENLMRELRQTAKVTDAAKAIESAMRFQGLRSYERDLAALKSAGLPDATAHAQALARNAGRMFWSSPTTALKAMTPPAPVPAPSVVTLPGMPPGVRSGRYGERFNFPPQPPASAAPPKARQGEPVTDASGNIIGTDVGGGRIIPTKQDADARATFRSLEQQLHEVERNLANPKNTLLSTSPAIKSKLDDWTRQRDDLRQRLSRLNPEAYPPATADSIPRGNGATGAIHPLPPAKGDLVTGTLYDTKRGVARWNGTAFEPVAVK